MLREKKVGELIKASEYNTIVKAINKMVPQKSVVPTVETLRSGYIKNQKGFQFDMIDAEDVINDNEVKLSAVISGGLLSYKIPSNSKTVPIGYDVQMIGVSPSSTMIFEENDEVAILIEPTSEDANGNKPEKPYTTKIIKIGADSPLSDEANFIPLGKIEKTGKVLTYKAYNYAPEIIDSKTKAPLFIGPSENLPSDEEIANDPNLAPSSDDLDKALRLRVSSNIIWMGEADGLKLTVDSNEALALQPTSIELDSNGNPIQPDPNNPTIIFGGGGGPIGGGGGGGGDSRLEFNLPLKKEGTQVSLVLNPNEVPTGLGQKLKIGVIDGQLAVAATAKTQINAGNGGISIEGADKNNIALKYNTSQYDFGWGLGLNPVVDNNGLRISGSKMTINADAPLISDSTNKKIKLKISSESVNFIFGSRLKLGVDGANNLAVTTTPCQRGYFQDPLVLNAVSEDLSRASIGLNFSNPLRLTPQTDANGSRALTIGLDAPLTLNPISDGDGYRNLKLDIKSEPEWLIVGGISFGASLYITPDSKLGIKLVG